MAGLGLTPSTRPSSGPPSLAPRHARPSGCTRLRHRLATAVMLCALGLAAAGTAVALLGARHAVRKTMRAARATSTPTLPTARVPATPRVVALLTHDGAHAGARLLPQDRCEPPPEERWRNINVLTSASKRVAVLLLPKSASSSVRAMFLEAFADGVDRTLRSPLGLDGTVRFKKDAERLGANLFDPPDANRTASSKAAVATAGDGASALSPPPPPVIAAFVRDPVERFLSGFEEAAKRAMFTALETRAQVPHYDRMVRAPGNLGADIRRFVAARADLVANVSRAPPEQRNNRKGDAFRAWLEGAQLPALLEDYLAKHHQVASPFDTHLRLQSNMLGGKVRRLDLIASIDDLAASWGALLRLARASPRLKDAYRRYANKGAPSARLAVPQLSHAARARLCEVVQHDTQCLGLRSRWCA